LAIFLRCVLAPIQPRQLRCSRQMLPLRSELQTLRQRRWRLHWQMSMRRSALLIHAWAR
jgi:hypothetical protein